MRLLFVLCALNVVRSPASAAAQTGGMDDFSVTATIGWNGVVPGDRWAPVTLHITAGERAVQGTVTLEFPQDPTQSAYITAPFAATPNKTTPVTVVAALPASCDTLRIRISAEGFRRRTLDFQSLNTPETIPLPDVLDETIPVVLVVGRTTLAEAARDWAGLAGELSRRNADEPVILEPAWGAITFAQAEPETLPIIPRAFDGLAAMVVPGDAAGRVDRAALSAVHDWVRSGGRLLILLDSPGDVWRDWLPPESRALALADAATRVPLPRDLGACITDFKDDLANPAAARKRLSDYLTRIGADRYGAYQPAPPTPGGVPDAPANAEPVPGPAADFPARPLRLGPDAIRTGWALEWKTAASDAGLIADGPVGFGHVTILGVEPTKTTALLSTRASGAVWRGALEAGLADLLSDATVNHVGRDRNWWYVGRTQSAINASLERLSNVPMVGLGVVLALGAALALLVLLIGPVDFFALRRLRAGQHWWLTALAWTALVSVGAYLAPQVIRASPTQVGRLSVVDQIASLPSSSGESPPPVITRASGLTGVYSGESGIIRPSVDASSWWRGTAPVFNMHRFRNRPQGRGMCPTVQAAAGGDSGSARGNPLTPFAMPLWTFRAFLDESRTGPDIAVRLRRSGEGWRAVVTGLPDGARVTWADLEYAGGHFGPPDGSARVVSGGAWDGPLTRSGAKAEAWRRVNDSPETAFGSVAPGVFNPGSALGIPGADQRTQTFTRLLATKRWAVLRIHLENCPPEPRLDRAATYDHTRILRIAVPLDEDPPPNEPPT